MSGRLDGSGDVLVSVDVTEPTVLDNPWLIALIVVAPVAALTVWWLARPGRGRRAT